MQTNPLQSRVQQDDVVKRTLVKPQTNENNVEMAFTLISCIHLKVIVSLTLHTDLMCRSAAIFWLFNSRSSQMFHVGHDSFGESQFQTF